MKQGDYVRIKTTFFTGKVGQIVDILPEGKFVFKYSVKIFNIKLASLSSPWAFNEPELEVISKKEAFLSIIKK